MACSDPASITVNADKGFSYSAIDESFVHQKKNHFQVTIMIKFPARPVYVVAATGLRKIDALGVYLKGVKTEKPTFNIPLEQAQPDRSKKPLPPANIELDKSGYSRIIVWIVYVHHKSF